MTSEETVYPLMGIKKKNLFLCDKLKFKTKLIDFNKNQASSKMINCSLKL